MSDKAILEGVTSYLIARLAEWNSDNCKAMPDGRPDPTMADEFASVHITQVQSVNTHDHRELEELWGFGVTLTKRISAVPYDRLSNSIYLQQLTGFSPIMTRIKLTLHNKYSLTQTLNTKLETTDTEINDLVEARCFSSPAVFINRSAKLRFHDDEWFHGYREGKIFKEGYVGVSMMLNFGNLRLMTALKPDTC
jgi:hypothetical protein